MEIEAPRVIKENKTIVQMVDLYGARKPGTTRFDNREEVEPIGLSFPAMKIDSIFLWFQNTDQQDVYC